MKRNDCSARHISILKISWAINLFEFCYSKCQHNHMNHVWRTLSAYFTKLHNKGRNIFLKKCQKITIKDCRFLLYLKIESINISKNVSEAYWRLSMKSLISSDKSSCPVEISIWQRLIFAGKYRASEASLFESMYF